uniref:Uncharacterized protein n=1 Tax=Anopheles culicifacies TaxID=139723 RepID=A0A182M644_9DIPT
MENDEKKILALVATDVPCSLISPKGGKRCAAENTSTPYHSAKKRLVLECVKTPSISPISNSTSRTSTLAVTPGQTMTVTRTLNITRGIQTIAPATTNRYCQVSVARIPKPTATVEVQTDECLLCPPLEPSPASPPPAVILIEAGCQTEEPSVLEISSDTTHAATLSSTPVQHAVVSCQADVVKQSTGAESNENAEQHQEQEEEQQPVLEEDDPGSVVESITAFLNDMAKQYGIDLQSSTDKKKKKKKSNTKKKEIEHLKECLANKTYKVFASKVNEKMSNIIEKHMTVYGRETVASRQRLIRWAKQFVHRQQLNRAAPGKPPTRKIVLVRKIMRAPKPPATEEKGVQYDQVSAGITVGTQWQRQKPMVTKKTPVSSRKKETRNKATPKLTSTDPKTCSAGSAPRRSMRQTKLSSYAKEQDDGKSDQGRQQRKQQGEHSPKPSKSSTGVTVNPTKSAKTTKAPPPPPPPPNKKKKRNEKKAPSIDIHIAETPSPERPEPAHEEKYLPYRSPPRYPTQCSKSTETSFLTPTRVRSFASERMDIDRPHLNRTRPYNPAVLLSPMERMYVEPVTKEPLNRPEYNTFLVPLRANESVPPTPSSRMIYTNPTERRVLLRSGPTTGGLVREKPPEVSIISSQQLYSQIGLAVEKALKNKTLPTLATMYGEPFIEVFNGCDEHHVEQQNKPSDDRLEEDARCNSKAAKQQPSAIKEKFVCSSGKEDVNLQASQQLLKRPPFHTERSPSLSPIIYQDENSEDEIIL